MKRVCRLRPLAVVPVQPNVADRPPGGSVLRVPTLHQYSVLVGWALVDRPAMPRRHHHLSRAPPLKTVLPEVLSETLQSMRPRQLLGPLQPEVDRQVEFVLPLRATVDGPHHEREDLLLLLLRRSADPGGAVLSVEVELQALLAEDDLQAVQGLVKGRVVALLRPGRLVACHHLPLLSRLGLPGAVGTVVGRIEVGRDQSVELVGLHPDLPLPTQRAACPAGEIPTGVMMAGTSTLMMSASLLSLPSAQVPPAGPVEAETSVGMVLVP